MAVGEGAADLRDEIDALGKGELAVLTNERVQGDAALEVVEHDRRTEWGVGDVVVDREDAAVIANVVKEN